MTAAPVDGRELRADRFHAGVRLAALLGWLGSVVVVFLLLRLAVTLITGRAPAGAGSVVVGVFALGLAWPLAWLIERYSVRAWPSGRAASLLPGRLRWRDGGRVADLDLRDKVNYWRWRFEVRGRRGGRVPNGYSVMAVRLIQGDTVVSLFAFVPPAAATALAAHYPFYELRRTKDEGKVALGGRDAIYLAAENERWEAGAELTPADFETLIAHLAESIPDFRTTPASGS
jgi:hypothetical protein